MYRGLGFAILLGLPSAGFAAEFELKDGDRVVLVGSTLIEREQRHGYWEAALTSRFPDRNVTFRNLGWSGDTVWGEARVGFDLDRPEKGFERLRDHVLALKPTVIIVGYGTNESFAGRAGLARFRDGLGRLLDSFAVTKARVILLAPLPLEKMPPPLPDPRKQNENLKLYGAAIRDIAERRGHWFIDLSSTDAESPTAAVSTPMTDNGMHLTALGYYDTAARLVRALWPTDRYRPTELKRMEKQAIKTPTLPSPPAPHNGHRMKSGEIITLKGLEPGEYTLLIDGRKAGTFSDKDLAGDSAFVISGPNFDQAEQLRRAIVKKNELYFHRWRPQNDTYLFGFRKHEQGRNAVEVPRFDPLVEKLEREITKLRVPAAHQYEVVRSE